jgi:hypothetical protein
MRGDSDSPGFLPPSSLGFGAELSATEPMPDLSYTAPLYFLDMPHAPSRSLQRASFRGS